VKLQQAYFSENSKFGSWAKIGYNAPGGTSGSSSVLTNFTYGDGVVEKEDDITSTETTTLNAKNNAKLNDCGSDYNWIVKVQVVDNADKYTASAGSSDACKSLTPNFEKIGI
jgi:hypothetical protein